MTKKNGKKNVRTRRNICAKALIAGALASIVFAGGARSALVAGYENIDISADGVVTLQNGKQYTLEQGESILPGASSSGNFDFTETGKLFTNNGNIGAAGEGNSVGNLDMADIGQFANNGEVYFNGTLWISVMGLQNTGTIEGNDGGINAAGDIINNNSGLITKSITTTKGLTNAGQIEGLVDASVLQAQNGTITNNNSITGYKSITSVIFINRSDSTLQNTNTVNATSELDNYGTINEGVNTISTEKLINQNGGLIDGVTLLTATNSLLNNGTISNTTIITANSGLENGSSGEIFKIGTINANNVTNKGHISDVGTISGRLSLEGGSISLVDQRKTKLKGGLSVTDGTFDVRVAPITDSAPDAGVDNDLYEVTPGTTVINGGTVQVAEYTTSEENAYKVGDQWTFLKTTPGNLEVNEELQVGDTNIPNLSDLLKFDTSYDSSNYYLNVVRAKAYAPEAQTIDERQFGRYLDNVGNHYVTGSDLEDVLIALDALSPGTGTSPAGQQAMAQLDGAVYGSMATMGIQNHTIVNNQLAHYMRPGLVDYTCSCCCDNEGCCGHLQTGKFWGNYYGVDGYVKSDGNAFGGDYSVKGVIVGGDRLIYPCFRLGAFFAYGGTQFDVNGLQEQVETDSYKAGLYFVRSVDSGYFLGNLNYGWDNYSATRNITFLDRRNTAETSGNQFGLRFEKGFNFSLREGTVFQPFAAFQYLYLDTNAFSESGEGTTALNVDKSLYDSYRSEFGGRIVWNRAIDSNRYGSMFLQASWLHEYGDTYGTITGSFNNPGQINYTGDYDYTVRGVDLGHDWCNLGIGGKYTVNNFSVFGGYDFMVNNSQNLHTGNVGIVFNF